MTTRVQDDLPLDLDKLREITRIDGASDVELTLQFEAAKEAADEYLNNPFTDDEGNKEPIPSSVKLGVYAWVQAHLSQFEQARTGGETSVSTDRLSVSYGTIEEQEQAIERRYWSRYRHNPGL